MNWCQSKTNLSLSVFSLPFFTEFYLHLCTVTLITLFGRALDFIQWQASTWSGWTSTSIFSNNMKTFPSESLSVTDSGISNISKHSRLEYCSFAQHWHSKNFLLTHNSVFTCFVIMTSMILDYYFILSQFRQIRFNIVNAR